MLLVMETSGSESGLVLSVCMRVCVCVCTSECMWMVMLTRLTM